jgi:hypothetical protein
MLYVIISGEKFKVYIFISLDDTHPIWKKKHFY